MYTLILRASRWLAPTDIQFGTVATCKESASVLSVTSVVIIPCTVFSHSVYL